MLAVPSVSYIPTRAAIRWVRRDVVSAANTRERGDIVEMLVMRGDIFAMSLVEQAIFVVIFFGVRGVQEWNRK